MREGRSRILVFYMEEELIGLKTCEDVFKWSIIQYNAGKFSILVRVG